MIFDIETDGLYDEVTKIHCLSWMNPAGFIHSTSSYEEMANQLNTSRLLIGHDINRYDIPVLEKILGVDLSNKKKIDTLPLSWYLFPRRLSHGLEAWGERFGVPKPKVDDWKNLSVEEYIHRCEEDVKINALLWQEEQRQLTALYGDDYDRIVSYLSFKMQCAAEQYKVGWKLDVDKAEAFLDQINPLIETKHEELVASMPDVPVYKTYNPPAKPYKKDGSLSSHGQAWVARLIDAGLPRDHTEPLTVCVGHNPPNPQSTPQLKDWLFSLGWKPAAFKFVREDNGKERRIPQIRVDVDGVKELCPSVERLAQAHPAVAALSELSVLQHRKGIVEGFLSTAVNGRVRAEIKGLTNTLRFRHALPCVNLPSVSKPYGADIRGMLTADTTLCGADVESLEATTKRHYMYPHDPEYADLMGEEGFDEHLDLAYQAGEVTQQQIKDYQAGDKTIKPIRNKFKPANYACVYGVQAITLARQTGMTVKEAQRLIDIYWERNWAVQEVSKECEVKQVNGEKWLFNPVSRFWYQLRFEKDRFSTLNQGTGVFVFDTWVAKVRQKYPLTAQFHDEVVLDTRGVQPYMIKEELQKAMDKTNAALNLNVTIKIDVQFGDNYAAVH